MTDKEISQRLEAELKTLKSNQKAAMALLVHHKHEAICDPDSYGGKDAWWHFHDVIQSLCAGDLQIKPMSGPLPETPYEWINLGQNFWQMRFNSGHGAVWLCEECHIAQKPGTWAWQFEYHSAPNAGETGYGTEPTVTCAKMACEKMFLKCVPNQDRFKKDTAYPVTPNEVRERIRVGLSSDDYSQADVEGLIISIESLERMCGELRDPNTPRVDLMDLLDQAQAEQRRLEGRIAELEVHEKQTHETLSSVLGSEGSLEECARKMRRALTNEQNKLQQALDRETSLIARVEVLRVEREHEQSENRKLQAHRGDPCIYCGIRHDNVEPGPCRADREMLRIQRDEARELLHLSEMKQQQQGDAYKSRKAESHG